MANIELDNLSGQEIKELMNTQKISINELDASCLRKLMDYETDMLCFGKGDVAIISKCSERLDHIDKHGISDEVFFNALNRAKADYSANIEAMNESSAKNTYGKTRFSARRLGIIVAAIVFTLVASILTVAAFGVNIFEYLNEVGRKPEGSQINVDGFTFHNAGKAIVYSSVEEFANAEKISILFPSELPEGVKFEGISVNKSLVGNKTITILTNDKRIFIEINTDVEEIGSKFDENELYQHDNRDYYIFYNEEYKQHFAFYAYGKDTYVFSADSYENLILIINSIKEIEQ